MKNTLHLNLQLAKEPALFLQIVKMQTGMEYTEILSKMIDLYKQVYFEDRELAWIKGDKIIQKLTIENLRRPSN